MWHGYAPHNPSMVQTYLTVFRAVNNFILVGEDGKTPAMRLGITKKTAGLRGYPVARAAGAAAEAQEAQGDAGDGLMASV